MTPAIGAEISGIDLMETVSDDLLDAVYEALIEHQVIFFPESVDHSRRP